MKLGENLQMSLLVCFFLQGFLTAIGNRERRLQLAIKHMFPVILHAAVTTLLAVGMLWFNDFDFIVR